VYLTSRGLDVSKSRCGASGPPDWALADIRDLGRLLYFLLTGSQPPGKPGEAMPAALWDASSYSPDTPTRLLQVGLGCASLPVKGAYHFPEAAALDLRTAVGLDQASTTVALPARWSPDAAMAKPANNRFDHYLLQEELGCGGFGVVYLAKDDYLDAQVALKVFAAGPKGGSLWKTWREEARKLYSLQHRNISRFEGMGEWKGRRYIATEWVVGETLAAMLSRYHARAEGKMPVEYPDLRWSAKLVETLARAVQFAHEQRVLHGDITPCNVIVSPEGEPKLIDFGLSGSLELQDVEGKSQYVSPWTGAGTPAYMAPEQVTPKAGLIGPATDVWALGTILYECLTLRRPYEGDSLEELSRQIRDPSIRPPHPKALRPELQQLDRATKGRHPTLARMALFCLQHDPAKRYKSAADLAKMLGLWLQANDPKG